MQSFSFPCPHCSATLRLKDRKFLGRQVDCPDCSQPLLIVANGLRELSARKLEPADYDDRSTSPLGKTQSRGHAERTPNSAAVLGDCEPAVPASRSVNRLARRLAVLKTPLGIAWSVAGCTTLLLLVAVWAFGGDKPAARQAAASDESPQQHPLPKSEIGAPTTAGHPKSEIRTVAEAADAETQLKRLGQRLNDFALTHGHFPAGTVYADGVPPEERFSWLAALAAEAGRNAGSRPLWDRSWQDPLNDRFVRRRIPEFQNTAVKPLVGANRYPATHFVGMAGVGVDAPQLPLLHPRSGIFGIDRRTKLDDVKDGTSHTILAAGVTEKLGSWSAGGNATIRAFTREPYINGPDGFGTGQADGMFVLMADGSVRFVSKQTEPTILRRMAAMSDGLPLDAKVPGEPGDGRQKSPPGAQPDGPAVAQAVEPDKPIPPDDPQNVPAKKDGAANNPEPNQPPQPPPEEKKVDVAAALKQPILSFEQVRPVPFQKLLRELEEMAGVPIHLDKRELGQMAAVLEKPVSLKLQNTTVGGLLRALVERVGLTYEIQSDGIQIHPAKQ